MPIFLITSATGRQGTSTARLLLAKGAQVNVLVRDLTYPAALALQSLGATLFKGGFNDISSITAAIQGVSSVFLNTPPDLTNPNGEAQTAEAFVAAARAAGTVQSFVVSTVLHANRFADSADLKADYPFLAQYYGSKAGAEKVIRASGFAYTILRPAWLMYNYIGQGTAYHFSQYVAERVLTVSSPRGWRVGHLGADDVGLFAAAALLDPTRFAGKEIELANESLTIEEVAAHLTEAVGAEVKVKYRTAEETAEARKVLPTLERQILAAADDVPDLAEYGFRLTTFKEFLEREKSAIRKTVGIN
ncbi:NAD dependent epimerase/dehydratase [Mycena galopus ATCC 62051]|nr:NAD dependent epimerase/dehydratase [Mycena galopus ATCC 62051]